MHDSKWGTAGSRFGGGPVQGIPVVVVASHRDQDRTGVPGSRLVVSDWSGERVGCRTRRSGFDARGVKSAEDPHVQQPSDLGRHANGMAKISPQRKTVSCGCRSRMAPAVSSVVTIDTSGLAAFCN